VLQKARDAGIRVVSHEGPGLENVDWNFELASASGLRREPTPSSSPS
jgi:simple sugar transport system substrate-binding protein